MSHYIIYGRMKVAKLHEEMSSMKKNEDFEEKSKNYYYIENFNDMIFSSNPREFDVPNEIKKMLRSLEKELNVINVNTGAGGGGTASFEFRKKSGGSSGHAHSSATAVHQKTEDNWRETAENIAKTFKATKFVEVENGTIEKKMTEFRGKLNKISAKNFSTQKPLIIEMINEMILQDGAAGSEIKENIFKIIIEIVGSNHFFSNLYAELYKELFAENLFFKEKILDFYKDFKLTIDEIHFVDNNTDYDGFCNYKKINDNRRTLTLFFVNLVKCNLLELNMLSETLNYFLDKSLQYIDEKDRMNEVEEISENVFVIISNYTGAGFSHEICQKIHLLSSMKVKEHSSFSNRVKFKYMDIVSAIGGT